MREERKICVGAGALFLYFTMKIIENNKKEECATVTTRRQQHSLILNLTLQHFYL